jgi:Asp-tRNA(Asn)/Glu-tRNA(Gln) amidotransferase A subunit family amidase
MLAIAREVLAQSPVPPKGFNGFEPDDLEGSLDRLAAFNRKSAKTHSGIYRDLTVRKRKTEIDDLLRDLKGPLTNYVGAIIHSIERGERICEVANLDLLAAYERALRLGTPINAISSLISAPDRALEGPLHGVAIAVKDIIDIKGQPRGNGNPNDMAGPAATSDAPVITALRTLGADVFATTTLLEYAAGATNKDVPEAMNPYNPKLTAGGSSGGSAAIVGAGICDVAIGTDTGGSIRIPAHYCGVVGFKPSHNSISLVGVTPLSPTFDHVGLLAKDVQTTVKVFSSLVPAAKPASATNLKGLRVGIIASHFEIPELEKDVKASIQNVIDQLKINGAEIFQVDGDVYTELEKTFGDILLYEAWQVHGEKITKDPEHFGLETRRLLQSAEETTKDSYEKALARRKDLLKIAETVYEKIDVLLSPACPYVSPETTPPIDTAMGAAEGTYTALANITGEPSISIPSGLDSNGLPIGVQFTSRIHTDMTLLSIAQTVGTMLGLKISPAVHH